jgi:hypothetical protein
MKRPDFGDILKIDKCSFSDVKGLFHSTGLKFPPKFLGYLTGHRWGAPTAVLCD